MNIFKVLQKESRLFYYSILTLGVINSIVYGCIMIFINNSVTHSTLPFFPEYDWLIFAVLIGVSLLCTKIFQTYMVRLTHKILYDFELSIIEKLRFATYQAFEKLGAERVYTAIGDVRILGFIPEVLVAVINSSVIIVCGLAYLFYVSVAGGVAILTLMGVLLVFYLLRNKKIETDLNKVRDLQNKYHQYLRDLLYGFKEVKMSITRNNTLYNTYIRTNRETGRELGVKSAVKYLDNELTGTYSWYIALGIGIFLLPRVLHLEFNESIPFVIIILYLMGPLASLVKVLPYYTNVKIALQRIHQIETEIDTKVTQTSSYGDQTDINASFEYLSFTDVAYEYFDEAMHKTFKVGPLNLEITKGELIFITGGNGSGKSTFVHMLTGLYKPTEGSIALNGHSISDKNYPYYSNQISAIFTSNYLFSENFDGFDLRSVNQELLDLVQLMQLQGVLKIDDERRFIDTGLSKGQQKRLAMIYALMEKRQIVVLDEWAAEQDPHYRAYFYKHLLPDLKRMGKTIIAVTHDDYYFPCADRVIRFDYGRIVSDERKVVKKEILNEEITTL